jgi:PAS domain S-box-containing protein
MKTATDKKIPTLLGKRLLKVLLVDDEATDRIPVEWILRTCSSPAEFVVESVVNLSEAIRKLTEKQYDVVLLDLELPDSSGIEILHRVVKVAPDIPIVVLTEQDDEQTGFSALEDGATDYLVKDLPLDVVLVRTIVYAIQRKKIQMQSLKCALDNNERMKELNCLYGISNLVETPGISLEEILEKTARLIPAGWQYPDIACARIIFEGKEYKTDNFKPSKWTQSADITHQGQKVGMVEVGYMEQRPQSDEGPFLEEKRDLIDAIGERLGKIAERIKAEEVLVFSNIILRTQQESSIDGILVVDEKGGILSFNQRFVDMWGIPLDVIESKSDERALQSVMDKLATPEEFTRKVKHLYEVREEICRDEVVLKDGRTFDRYSAPMLGDERKYYGRVWYFRDITERKQAEEALREKSSLLVKVINSVPDFIFAKDTKLRTIICNEAYASAVGKKPEEMFGHTDIECGWDTELVCGNPAKGIRGFENDDRDALSGKMIHNPCDPANTLNGVLIFDTYKMPLWGKDGEIIGMLGISRDITERKRTEEQIRLASEEWEMTFNSITDLVFIQDKDFTIKKVNKTFAALLKMNPKDIIGKKCYDILHNLDHPWPGCPLKKAKQDGASHTEEVDDPHIGIPLLVTVSPIIDANGEIIGAVHIARDITEGKRAEEALRESERKMHTIFDQTFQFIGLMTIDGILIEANRTLLKFSDIEASSVLNKPFWQGPWWSHSPELQEKLRQAVGKAARGEFIRFEATHVAKDGILHYVDFSLKPVKDETGKVIFMIPEGRDITEFKNKGKRNFS